MTFFEDGEAVWSNWTPKPEHQGYEGIVHGGLITTVLDEVMGWAIYVRRLWAVTGTINVRFRKPVRIGEDLVARAWVDSVSGRKVDVRATLSRVSDSEVLAEASAIFIRVSEEQAASWQGRYFDQTEPS